MRRPTLTLGDLPVDQALALRLRTGPHPAGITAWLAAGACHDLLSLAALRAG